VIYRLGHFFMGCFFRMAYSHEVIGLENVPQDGCIIAANHTSFLDPPLVGVSIPFPVYFLARATLFKGGFRAFVLRSLNAIPMTQEIDHRAFSAVGKSKTIVIFPEGTRSKEGELESFSPGVALLAKKLGLPVVPAYISGAYEVWPRGRRFPRLWGKTGIAFGKPCYLRDFEGGSRKEQYREFTKALEREVFELKTRSNSQ